MQIIYPRIASKFYQKDDEIARLRTICEDIGVLYELLICGKGCMAYSGIVKVLEILLSFKYPVF